MTDIVERLRQTELVEKLTHPNSGPDALRQAVEILKTEIERLTAECEAWRECARYDPKMEGPAFKGWDRSALDRCRARYIEMKP